jgi:DNA-binding PadR family transcriptional regulator
MLSGRARHPPLPPKGNCLSVFVDVDGYLFYFVEQKARMGKGEYLGEFEQIVLLAVLHLGSNAYGVTILEEIGKRTGRSVMIGAVYATLDRLEGKRYISSKVGDPTPERGGRAKRFFKVTAKGAEALVRSRRILENMWAGLNPVLEEP